MTERELSKKAFPQTWKTLQDAVVQEVAPGFVAGLWRASDPDGIELAAIGKRRLALDGLSELPMLSDTVFDLASITKVFGTAALMAALVDRKWIDWEDPVRAVLPEYPWGDIRFSHLLSHTAGYGAWQPLWEKLRADFAPRPLERVSIALRQAKMREHVLLIRPEAGVGERALYSDLGFLVLGFALEALTSLPLDRAVPKWVWEPMGLKGPQGPYYHRIQRSAPEDRDERVAATERSVWRSGVLQGQVHDDNCWAMGGYGGHAGAFGTAAQVLHFASGLLRGFHFPATLSRLWSPPAQPLGCERTLGWDRRARENPSAGNLFSARSVGHLGYTGTSLWIDPEAGIAVTLLSNRVHPSRENEKIRQLRPLFHTILRQELGK